MDTPYNKKYEQKRLIDYFAIELKKFKDKWDKRSWESWMVLPNTTPYL